MSAIGRALGVRSFACMSAIVSSATLSHWNIAIIVINVRACTHDNVCLELYSIHYGYSSIKVSVILNMSKPAGILSVLTVLTEKRARLIN